MTYTWCVLIGWSWRWEWHLGGGIGRWWSWRPNTNCDLCLETTSSQYRLLPSLPQHTAAEMVSLHPLFTPYRGGRTGQPEKADPSLWVTQYAMLCYSIRLPWCCYAGDGNSWKWHVTLETMTETTSGMLKEMRTITVSLTSKYTIDLCPMTYSLGTCDTQWYTIKVAMTCLHRDDKLNDIVHVS